MVFRVNRAGISRRSQLTGVYIRKWIANEGEGGGGSSVYYRTLLGSGKFYWDTTSQIKRLRALVGNSNSKMLSLRINKIFLQRFSRCADQTYLHISARKSLLSETPLGNCFDR